MSSGQLRFPRQKNPTVAQKCSRFEEYGDGLRHTEVIVYVWVLGVVWLRRRIGVKRCGCGCGCEVCAMGLAARIRDIEFYSIESVVSGSRLGMTRRLCFFFCHVP
jgi:hypothetical protein